MGTRCADMELMLMMCPYWSLRVMSCHKFECLRTMQDLYYCHCM